MKLIVFLAEAECSLCLRDSGEVRSAVDAGERLPSFNAQCTFGRITFRFYSSDIVKKALEVRDQSDVSLPVEQVGAPVLGLD